VYISSRTAKTCEDTAARLTKEGPGECIAIPADLAKYEECERLVKELEKREEGRSLQLRARKRLMCIVLNVLVNNSGATWGEPLDKYPDQAWTKLLTLNVQRVFTLTQKLIPMLEKGSKKDGVGRVINVSCPPFAQQPQWLIVRLAQSMVSRYPVSRPMRIHPPKQLCTSKPLHFHPSRALS
jgi:NAD(P)-dependent dehydrogenase (short-subunit alcohol dehydrogenase family)